MFSWCCETSCFVCLEAADSPLVRSHEVIILGGHLTRQGLVAVLRRAVGQDEIVACSARVRKEGRERERPRERDREIKRGGQREREREKERERGQGRDEKRYG